MVAPPIRLPGRPLDVQPETGEILLINGDPIQVENSFNTLKDPFTPNLKKDMRELHDKDYNATDDLDLFEAKALTGTATLAAAAILAAEGIRYVKEKSSRPQKKIPRRDFLKIMGLGLTFAAYTYSLGRYISPNLASSAPTEAEKNLWASVADITKPLVVKSDWQLFRSATLIAKLEDTIPRLGFPNDTPASVLMGFAHELGEKDLMQSLEKRREAIGSYAQKLVYILKKVHQTRPTFDVETAKKLLFHYLATTSVFKVRDPHIASPDRTFYNNAHHYQEYLGNFQSAQVAAALSPILSSP